MDKSYLDKTMWHLMINVFIMASCALTSPASVKKTDVDHVQIITDGGGLSTTALDGGPTALLGEEQLMEITDLKPRDQTKNSPGKQQTDRNGKSSSGPDKTDSITHKTKDSIDIKALKSRRHGVKDRSHRNKSPSGVPDTEQSMPSLDNYRVQTCVPNNITMCRDLDLYPLAQYPNHLGHKSEAEAAKAFTPYEALFRHDRVCGRHLRRFLCVLLAPQCTGTEEPLLPCRGACTKARRACGRALGATGLAWPPEWSCDKFSDGGLCVEVTTGTVTPVPEPILHHNLSAPQSIPWNHHPPRSDVVFDADNSDTNRIPPARTPALEPVVASPRQDRQTADTSGKQIRPRNYNIGQLGEAELFQGWADVQGQGAANDYCRVIGQNPTLRFLSCSLGGSTKPGHVYVSKRGFDVGHRNTWFMRDADGDGRDDYCRCVGKGLKSVVSCMKAGELGFYGSPRVPGSEFTFEIKTSAPCFQKRFNPFIGI